MYKEFQRPDQELNLEIREEIAVRVRRSTFVPSGLNRIIQEGL